MFPLCISDEKKFHHETKGTVTVVPVYVEFGKIYPLTSSPNSIGKSIKDHEAGMELLHTVAGLYFKHLPHIPLKVIYETLCKEGVKTLLLLRHGEEILKEWRDELRTKETNNSQKDNREDIMETKDFLLDEMIGSSQDELSPEVETENGMYREKEFSIPSFEELSLTSSCSKTFSSGVISDLEDDSDRISSEFLTNINKSKTSKEKYNKIRKKSIQPTESTRATLKNPKNYRELEAKLERCFDDEPVNQTTEEPSFNDDDSSEQLSQLMATAELYIDCVNERRRKRELIKSSDQLVINHVAIEHRIIAAISFHKDYRLPSISIIFIDWIIVRNSYRYSKIGQYLLKKIKSSSLVGTYHLMTVTCPSESVGFFQSSGFIADDISEGRLRPLFDRVHIFEGQRLFYYPSYRSLSLSLLGPLVGDSFYYDFSLKSISDEIDSWRERSLESYHDSVSLVCRLKSEIAKLHSQLKSKEKQLKDVNQENKELRHIITQSNAMAAISTIDELGIFFESIKDLCSALR